MVVIRTLKEILTLKIKPRHDSVCDQFSRLIMTKMLFISGLLMGYDYFTDKIHCIHHPSSTLNKDFVDATCWITGFFIYQNMTTNPPLPKSNSIYYGIPREIKYDGINGHKLCQSTVKYKVDENCIKMDRVAYTQYQWMPFYIGALSLLFYAPYIGFQIVNVDIISLKSAMKSLTVDPEKIVRNYFNYKVNPIHKLRLCVFFNVLVKCLYIVVNVFAFYFTDYVLYGRYKSYGTEYLEWSKQSIVQYSWEEYRNRGPRPGDKLLPSMGLCEVDESSLTITDGRTNYYLMLCEYSTNVLYQYILIVLWFLFVISFSISVLGLLGYISEHIFPTLWHHSTGSQKNTIYRHITLREIEYLQFIEKKDMVIYGDVLRQLKEQRMDLQSKGIDSFDTSNGFVV